MHGTAGHAGPPFSSFNRAETCASVLHHNLSNPPRRPSHQHHPPVTQCAADKQSPEQLRHPSSIPISSLLSLLQLLCALVYKTWQLSLCIGLVGFFQFYIGVFLSGNFPATHRLPKTCRSGSALRTSRFGRKGLGSQQSCPCKTKAKNLVYRPGPECQIAGRVDAVDNYYREEETGQTPGRLACPVIAMLLSDSRRTHDQR